MDFGYEDYEPNNGFDSDMQNSKTSGLGFDSDDSRVRFKTKGSDGLGCYNLLKILNNLLYL